MNSREQLRLGVPMHFDPAAPEADRIVEAAWVEEAVAVHARVDLEHALVRGPLNLRYTSIDKDLRMVSCTIREGDFSYATCKGIVDFSRSTFQLAPNFQGAVFEIDVLLEAAHFLSGEVRWSRATVQQRMLAEGVVFGAAASAHFDGWTCGDSAVFTRAVFGESADFNGAHIRGSGQFSGAVFSKPVTFENARFDGDLIFGVGWGSDLAAADFAAEAKFQGINVNRWTNFRGVQFHGEASFVWAKFDGAASFGLDANGLNAAWFGDKADFRDAVLTGDADFEGVVFRDQAKFSSALFKGTAIFKAAEFHSTVECDGIETGAELNFEKACLRSSDQPADFEKAIVKGSAFFSESTFNGAASFEGMKIEGAVAKFRKVHFNKAVSFSVSEFKGTSEFHEAQFSEHSHPLFECTHFSGSCSFDHAVFDDDVGFEGTAFDNEACFRAVAFRKDADFSVSHFSGIARFDGEPATPGGAAEIPAATFTGKALFEHARFDRDARFDNTQFLNAVNFREASFRVVYFAADGRAGGENQIRGPLDLTGCTYERIQADWKSLLKSLHIYEQQANASYSRQPYAQMEKAYRAVGQDRAADDIYLERRSAERKRLRLLHEPIAWFLDRLYWCLANYGVRPFRLAVFTVLCFIFGTLMFHHPGSVQTKNPAASVASSSPPTAVCPMLKPGGPGWWDAARLSARYFIPVEISLLPSCEASINPLWGMTSEDWAAGIRILGWVLVPVGIASLSGILRRAAP
jgi:pentapeptide repeat protein